MDIIEYKNYSLSFGETEILKNINFKVKENSIIGIIGESGSGKTVTGMSLVGLLQNKKQSGEILFKGKNVIDYTEEEKEKIRGKEIGIVFQDPLSSLDPLYKVEDALIEALIKDKSINKIEAKKLALDMLTKVGISDGEEVLKMYPHQLSGGMRQRILIGASLLLNPEVLIADEITTALDVTIQAQILELIKKIKKEKNMTVVIITHDLGVCAEICDYIVVMKDGKVIETGDVFSIFENPKEKYTKELLEINKENYIEENTILEEDIVLAGKKLTKEFFETKGLFNKKKDGLKAVDDISFKLLKGETLGIVGESGSGKSTLGKLIVRLLECDSGEIILHKENFSKVKGKELKKLRSKIQMVFQDPYSSLNPTMNIKEIMLEGIIQNKIYEKKIAEEKIIELLNICGLRKEDLYKYPREFSGGQCQRICIARALSLKPEIIVLDEAISSLDIKTRNSIIQLLKKIQREYKTSYIFISHDLEWIRKISHRIMIMYLGSVMEEGEREKIYNNPKHPYTKSLMNSIPVKNPKDRRSRELLEGEIPSGRNLPKGCKFYTRCKERKDICKNEKPKFCFLYE
ncbi:ABC transporter ATP-binding protein [uncultured Clostridium sp.]|uniref:dipeptide ABC transporter ATP-binding protein n=1 Tax=uncultured Clostridium sp. TaxID=59620 RepID=UPI0026097CD0|nr:ABC transporter ATP-binding protein [uncultured Clostridium sp.]